MTKKIVEPAIRADLKELKPAIKQISSELEQIKVSVQQLEQGLADLTDIISTMDLKLSCLQLS